MTVLETHAICRFFRRGAADEVRAVNNVSLAIEQGSLTLLTGPSGSGKTTLLALLGLLDRPTSGSLLVYGRELTHTSDVERTRVRRRFGFVFQQFSLIDRLPVWENVTYPLVPRGVSRAARREIARRLLASLGMENRLCADPSTLSGGEQQRAAVARALAVQPDLLLADEPTSNLDPASARTVLRLLNEIHTGGTTVVISSHDPNVLPMATTVWEMDSGRLKTPEHETLSDSEDVAASWRGKDGS